MDLTVDNLGSFDATALAQIIAQRKISSKDLTRMYLDRIEKYNGTYNAIVTLDKEQIIAQAEAIDDDLLQGKLRGPLHGVPVTIKDSIKTAGLRTTAGYRRYRDFIPSEDAEVVKRLKQAGAIIIGKTNCAKLCCDIQTSNHVFGVTNNPWDVSCTSGGSSGGEAVAIALAFSALGVGSDTGGSIRIPASYCGVYGFKPSLGKIPSEGHIPPLPNGRKKDDHLTVVGPIASSARDLMLGYQILSGESIDSYSLPESSRIAWTQEFDTLVIDDEVSTGLQETFNFLRDNNLNVAKVKSPLDFEATSKLYLDVFLYEFFPKQANYLGYYLYWLYVQIRCSMKGGVEQAYQQLMASRSKISSLFGEFMEEYDFWILPANSSVAYPHRKINSSFTFTQYGEEKEVDYMLGGAGLMLPFSLIGNPSIVVPVSKNANGMPVAIQIVCKTGDDLKLLRFATYISDVIGRSHTP